MLPVTSSSRGPVPAQEGEVSAARGQLAARVGAPAETGGWW